MEKIILDSDKIQEIYDLFEGKLSLELIEKYLETTDDLPPIEYQSSPESFNDAQGIFLSSETASVNERGSFRKMVELAGKATVPLIVGHLMLLPKYYPEEDYSEELKMLVVRRVAELLNKK